MKYYVLTKNGNQIVGITRQSPYNLSFAGECSIHEMDGPIPDLNQYEWDFEADDFIRLGTIYTKREFLSKFTFEERAAIRSSDNILVLDLMDMLELADYISVEDPETIQGINFLAYVGLIAAPRITEILS
jgi:hypothetical protein